MARQSALEQIPAAGAILALLLAACSGNGGGALGLAQWSLTEELRIAGIPDPPQPLAPVGSVAVDRDGRAYIAQPQLATVRVFDADGRHVADIGSPGNEPGQFGRVYALGFLADTLYAIDLDLRRITYFSTDGELIRSRQVSPPPVSPPFFPGMPFAVFPDGSMAIGTAFPATITAEDLRRVPQLRIDAAYERLDTVTWIAYERTGRRASYEGRPISVGSPLSDDVFAVFSSDGERLVTVDRAVPLSAEGATFGVTVSDGWGDTIYSRRYEYEPVSIEDQVIERTVAERASVVAGAFPSPQEAQAFVRSTMFLPVYYPPVASAAFSDTGEVWIRREAIAGQRQRWMVLDQGGEPIAEATLPEPLQVMVIQDGAVWGVLSQGMGSPVVVRYGIGTG